MGKTPEKGELALRYRPKVVKDPAAGAQTPQQLPVSDNQREHEPVDESAARKKRPTFTRKKKAPAVTTQKARSFSDSTAASTLALTSETASVEHEQPKPKATFVKKDVKAKNRRTAHDRAAKEQSQEDNQQAETAAAAVEAAPTPLAPKPTAPVARYLARKPYKKVYQKRQGSAPTKQVLWKAKYPQPSAIAEPLQVATQQQEQVVVASARDDEDEELAYTLQERQSMKLHTADEVTKQQHMAFPVESSSQETQSGSEDESSFLQFSNFVPSVMMEPSAIMEGALEQYFPVVYPLEALAAIRNGGGFVHEIILEDFMFVPAELAIHTGDVVVWRVSPDTLGMVEHCLELSFQSFDASNGSVTALTPTLAGGSAFAYRFESAGSVHVDCSVYKTRGVIKIVDASNQITEEVQPVIESVKRRKTKATTKKSKLKMVNAAQSQHEADISSRQETESITVFHPPKDLSRLPDVDPDVCRAVLAHLEDVRMSTPVIVVGDVACPVMESTGSDSNVTEAEVAYEVGGFQQHIIAMLKKSEEGQVRKRNSFLLPQSPFDAASSYDFFKRRFGDVKNAEQRIIYCSCPEQTSAYSGLGATDLVNLLRM